MASRLMTYRDLLEQVNRNRTPGRATRLVAVDGHGGAGKSTFAQRLAAHAERASIVEVDDFAHPGLTNGIDVQRLREQVIVPLSNDRPARYQRFDWNRQQLADWRHVVPGGLVIVEGVSALRREFNDPWDLTVWVETPREICLQRGLQRDGQDARPHWDAWFAAGDDYVTRDRPRDKADLTVDGAPSIDHDPNEQFLLTDVTGHRSPPGSVTERHRDGPT